MMGLTIGISAKRQYEAFMSEGRNPKGTAEEIEEQIHEMLAQKFLTEGDTFPFGLSVTVGTEKYDFDVSFPRYGEKFTEAGHTFTELYLVLAEYILDHFSSSYGIDMHKI